MPLQRISTAAACRPGMPRLALPPPHRAPSSSPYPTVRRPGLGGERHGGTRRPPPPTAPTARTAPSPWPIRRCGRRCGEAEARRCLRKCRRPWRWWRRQPTRPPAGRRGRPRGRRSSGGERCSTAGAGEGTGRCGWGRVRVGASGAPRWSPTSSLPSYLPHLEADHGQRGEQGDGDHSVRVCAQVCTGGWRAGARAVYEVGRGLVPCDTPPGCSWALAPNAPTHPPAGGHEAHIAAAGVLPGAAESGGARCGCAQVRASGIHMASPTPQSLCISTPHLGAHVTDVVTTHKHCLTTRAMDTARATCTAAVASVSSAAVVRLHAGRQVHRRLCSCGVPGLQQAALGEQPWLRGAPSRCASPHEGAAHLERGQHGGQAGEGARVAVAAHYCTGGAGQAAPRQAWLVL